MVIHARQANAVSSSTLCPCLSGTGTSISSKAAPQRWNRLTLQALTFTQVLRRIHGGKS